MSKEVDAGGRFDIFLDSDVNKNIEVGNRWSNILLKRQSIIKI